ncbi:MAG: transposase, partial [Terriglobales bacterium]
GLKRYYGADHLHFINCSCYPRQRWLDSRRRRDLFLRVLEQARRGYDFVVVGYVVMPEHIHLLVSEPAKGNPSRVMQAMKQGFARRVLRQMRRRRLAAQGECLRVKPSTCGSADFMISTYGASGSGSRSCAICIATR